MKKLLSLVMVFTLVVFSFAAGHIDLANGTYRAEMVEASHGWVDFVELTVKDGKIADVLMDSYNVEDGSLKSNDANYAKNMGMDPEKYFGELAKDLEKSQNIDEVDTVTGATHSSDNFRALVKGILERGVTDGTIAVNVLAYNKADGTYRAEATEPIHGWTDFLEITVKNGKITKVVADAFNADGGLKTKDPNYAKNMGMDPAKFFATLADRLVKADRPADVDTVTGATSSSDAVRFLAHAIKYRGVPGETIKVNFSNFAASNLPDGEYRAEMAEAEHGWTDFLEITVKNGIIVDAYADAFNANGGLKTDDPVYAKNMGMEPSRFYSVLSYRVIAEQSASEVDTFTGASGSSANVKNLLSGIIENGKPGKTIKVK
ncbi:FMN-binding protein [Geotoga petraea]|nr:FMN-binding protein [Geotoga petraea]